MNGHLVIALAVGAAVVALTDSTILLAGTGVTVSAAGLAAGAAVVGALAVGAAAAVALARRGKREVASCLPFGNPELYFSMAANSDFLDCGRRFVCELEATADGNLSEEEILIRNFFGRRNSAVNGTAGTFFTKAGSVGAINGVAACAKAFSTCPFDRKTIFLAFKEAQKAQ